MSRSGYSDGCDLEQWSLIRWRGAVKSAIRGKRGQLFLLEMLAALDALPEPKLIAKELVVEEGAVCALGAVAKRRGVDMSALDPEDHETVAGFFGLPDALTREIVYENDECGIRNETPEARYTRMRQWVLNNLRDFDTVAVPSDTRGG